MVGRRNGEPIKDRRGKRIERLLSASDEAPLRPITAFRPTLFICFILWRQLACNQSDRTLHVPITIWHTQIR